MGQYTCFDISLNRLLVSFKWLLCVSLLCISSISFAESLKPPGKYVLFENFRLYYYCIGSGSHAVIIDGGIGDSSANWMKIQASLADKFRICIYDRGGYGMSDSGPGIRSSNQILIDLSRLIKAIELKPPYIIVGQSFGGFTAQLFAKRFPRETAGIVLVDSSHPDQLSLLDDLDIQSDTQRDIVKGRVIHKMEEVSQLQQFWYQLNSKRKAIFAQMDELKYFEQSAEEVKAAGPMPDIPIAVLTRGKRLLPTMKNNHSMEDVWREMQEDLANSSKQGWQKVIAGSGHNIHLDAPEEIVKAVIAVYQSSLID